MDEIFTGWDGEFRLGKVALIQGKLVVTGEREGEQMGGWKARASSVCVWGGVKNHQRFLSRRLRSESGDERQQVQDEMEWGWRGRGLGCDYNFPSSFEERL